MEINLEQELEQERGNSNVYSKRAQSVTRPRQEDPCHSRNHPPSPMWHLNVIKGTLQALIFLLICPFIQSFKISCIFKKKKKNQPCVKLGVLFRLLVQLANFPLCRIIIENASKFQHSCLQELTKNCPIKPSSKTSQSAIKKAKKFKLKFMQ